MTAPSTAIIHHLIHNEHRLWLQRLELVNYRCFSRLKIDFDERLTVLIARNGLGKSTILDAVAAAFGTFVGSFHAGKSTGISTTDVRVKLVNPRLHQMEAQFPAAILAEGEVDGTNISWGRHLSSPKTSTTVKEARPLTVIGEYMQYAVTRDAQVVLPLLAYYGTGRLWKEKKKQEEVLDAWFDSRTYGYKDCLDPASTYKQFIAWFRHIARVEAEMRTRELELSGGVAVDFDTPYSPLIFAIRQAVDICLQITGWHRIRYSFAHRAVVMEHPEHGVLEVEQMSDGVRNMIATVADIGYRMVRLNPQFGADAARLTPGLVLIDEVDMHLHPEWQQVVIQHLTEAFPMVQFIVTTHSPQVISTVRRENIRELSENIDGEDIAAIPVMQTYGRSNADILQATMKVSPVPEVQETDKLRRYLRLIEQGDFKGEEARALRRELNDSLGFDHPALLRADKAIRRREVLQR